jgi:hypothetical protein
MDLANPTSVMIYMAKLGRLWGNKLRTLERNCFVFFSVVVTFVFAIISNNAQRTYLHGRRL